MYFDNFPRIPYTFTINGVDRILSVVDISLNIRPLKEVLNNATLYNLYLLQDGDTPENVAERMYGDPGLHWVVMLVNEKYDYINDFPVSAGVLEQIVLDKYGAGNRNAQHSIFGRAHWNDIDGNIVDPDAPGAFRVSNYDYEVSENEKKRNIKLIDKTVIGVFVSDLISAFKTNG